MARFCDTLFQQQVDGVENGEDGDDGMVDGKREEDGVPREKVAEEEEGRGWELVDKVALIGKGCCVPKKKEVGGLK